MRSAETVGRCGGWKHTPEARAKIAAARLGKKWPLEQRLKMSESHRRHGHTAKLGVGVSPTWQSWRAMIRRCTDPGMFAYDRYGGRGISVYSPWLVFENFLADMGERPAGTSLDRVNGDGHYEPGNVRWATKSEQNRNRRPLQRGSDGRYACTT